MLSSPNSSFWSERSEAIESYLIYNGNMRKPTRAVGIVIESSKVLLIHRKNEKEYYVFPGGGVEENETIEEAVIRELKEETSIKVKIKKLLYIHHIVDEQNDSDQYFYLCEYLSGIPKLGDFNELQNMKSANDFYEPLWYPTQKLSETLLYPLEIRDWLIWDFKNDFSDKTKEETFKISELRQSF